MAYKYKFASRAKKDLDIIVNYIANTLCNKTAAIEFIQLFEEKIQIICEYPESGMLLDNTILKDTIIRKIYIDQYIAFYKMVNKRIVIVRILFGKRDLGEIIKKL
ncbi:MAG: type II toxin-antitoxin system RelE/ParE family toxin [Clostridiales bacterium]|nr:type II toxin-antitoxin system RelE/ParE family toxin [Clostridiales bacterium]